MFYLKLHITCTPHTPNSPSVPYIFWGVLHWVLDEACGILVPQRGMEPVSAALEGGFSVTGPPGKPSCTAVSFSMARCT